MKKAYIVSVLGYWGRGKTVKEAAENCAKEGGRRKDKAIIWLVLGDDKPEINSNGNMMYNHLAQFEKLEPGMGAFTESLMVAKFIPLGTLMNLV